MAGIKKLVVGQLQTNCYLIISDNEVIIADPGDDADYIISTINSLSLQPLSIIATHGHFDHVLAAYELQTAYSIPFYIHKDDAFLLQRAEDSAEYFTSVKSDPAPKADDFLTEGQIFKLGNGQVKITGTPGHTPGSITIVNDLDNWLIPGDLVFSDGYLGRTDFKYSDKRNLKKSLKKILEYPDEYYIYPGHGDEITVGELKRLLK